MIQKINIKKFGLFSDYEWSKEIGNDPKNDNFKKVNIIYGRNYSGKTTLSRIFRCIEKQEIHKDYPDANFSLETDDGTVIHSHPECSKKIRVYNTDFVKENLSWLHNTDGSIEPFTLLGSGNVEIENKINEIQEKLGDVESESGLYYKQLQDKEQLIEVKKVKEQKHTELESKLRHEAKEIKFDSSFIKQGINYTIANISTEIKQVISEPSRYKLREEEKEIARQLIKEDSKDNIPSLSLISWDLSKHIHDILNLITSKIEISKTIQELIVNNVLQEWVNKGREYHRGKKERCAFCGNPIDKDRWELLDAHFSKESEDLKNKLNAVKTELDSLYAKISAILVNNGSKKEKLYVNFHQTYDQILEEWQTELSKFKTQIDILKEKINERLNDIFTSKVLSESDISDNSLILIDIIKKYNDLVEQHNSKSVSLDSEKEAAQKSLRYDHIHKFIVDIDYEKKIQEITSEEKGIEEFGNNLTKLNKQIKVLEDELELLKLKQKDEGLAAQKINDHLKDFFGHEGLKLEPEMIEGEVSKSKFVVKRGEQQAINLSEGECSLVAFCYFMAKIEDEINDESAKDNLIIYIDDPISSLDNNHIFFMYGLIESIIIMPSPRKFDQLFISTHNLEFLKHLSNLNGFKNTAKNVGHYLIEKRKNDTAYKSIIRTMPRYLRVNISEYLYLFDQIYELANSEKDIDAKIKFYEDNYTLLYTMGNTMRKFLECYMSYRFPAIDSPLHNLNLLFDTTIPRQINRLVNEYSHLVWGARGTLPIDVPEAEDIAQIIMNAIEKKDPDHYNSLLKCVNTIETT